MIAANKRNVATREAVEHLDQKFGRKSLYIGGAIVLVVVGVLLLRTCGGKTETQPPPAPRPVAVAKIVQKDVPLYLEEIGTCAAFQSVQVQAQVAGQIIARNFKDGADVKKGDLLFTIDPRPYQAALDQAKGLLAQAKAQVALDLVNIKRQQDLRAKNVISQQEFDASRATLTSDEAKLQSAEAALAAAQVNLDFCEIRSPLDGTAGLRNVDVGNIVGGSASAGGTVLVTIQELDPIYTDFTIAEPDLAQVRRYLDNPALKVVTDADDDNVPPRMGQLYFLDQAVQPGTGTIKARAVTANPDRALWPSQFVHVRLILDDLKDAKLVPTSAVQIGQKGPYIFVVRPDSTLDLRSVKPGQVQGDLTVITEGVKAGESVVVSGQLQLAPGDKVAAKAANPGASPAPGPSGAKTLR
ncbi:MAG: efflux RND transporter periplasmic adaptor subunit [Chthoniobacterales bacterium]|nr:efflux RND transporter periplasmic adaptor subunit [Chthoniobacterales bacterium]